MRILALIAPFAAGLLAILARDRMTALLIFFGYLSVEGMIKLMGNYHPVVHIGLDIVLWMMIGVWVMRAILARRASLPRVPMLALVGLHVTWIIVLLFSPYTASLYVGLASFKIHLSMIPLYVLGYLAARNDDDPRRFLRVLTVLWAITFVFTIFQYVAGPGSPLDVSGPALARFAAYFHEWRPFGTTALPGGQAVYAFLAVPFALCLILRGEYRLRDPIMMVCISAAAAVFFVSGARQLLLGCLIILLVMSGLQVMRRQGRVVGVGLALLILGVSSYVAVEQVILPEAQATLGGRLDVPKIWQQRNPVERFRSLLEPSTYATARSGGIGLIVQRLQEVPLGAGLGRTGSAGGALAGELADDPFSAQLQARYGFQDNFFAAMLVETGIPGTLLLTTILVGMLVIAVRLALESRDPPDAALGSLVAGYMAAMLVMSWGSQPLLSNPLLAFFWFLGGLAGGRLRIQDARHRSPLAEPAA